MNFVQIILYIVYCLHEVYFIVLKKSIRDYLVIDLKYRLDN